MAQIARVRVVVHGRVHGVGFRAACARLAGSSGVGGWVRNNLDGTVEAAFEGDPAHVSELVDWCSTGPAMARVTRVEKFGELPCGEEAFRIR